MVRLNGYRGGALEEIMEFVRKAERRDLSARMLSANTLNVASRPVELCWDESRLSPFKGKVPAYVKERGLSLSVCKEFELGYDEQDKRLVFPVRNKKGSLVGITGRSIYDRDPRYKDYSGFEKGKYLYAEHKLDRSVSRIILVEGFMDVLKLYQAGFKNTVASMGARITRDQIQKLLNWDFPVWLMQDNDKAGREARSACVSALRGRIDLYDVPLPDDGDPDEMTPDKLKEVLAQARMIF